MINVVRVEDTRVASRLTATVAWELQPVRKLQGKEKTYEAVPCKVLS